MKSIITAIMFMVSTSAFAGGFTAIVYNEQSGNWGASGGEFSRYDAEQAALNVCTDCFNPGGAINAGNIEAGAYGIHETWTHNGYIALAIGYDGNGHRHWGTSQEHYSQEAAEQSALGNCQNGIARSSNPVGNCSVVKFSWAFD